MTIDIQDRITVYPVVVTGKRWPSVHEGHGAASPQHDVPARFPFLKDDPRYADYGACRDGPGNPPPGSRGGGLFPVLCKTPDGTLVCAVRTAASHKRMPGAEISLTVSKDRGKTWSPYRVVVQGREGQDCRNACLGVVDDTTFVLAYGVFDLANHDKWVEVIRSCDGGRTWSRPDKVTQDIVPDCWMHPHGQMLHVEPDTLVFNARGAYSDAARKRDPNLPRRESCLHWSFDNGRTFTDVTYLGPRSETSVLPLDRDHWICYTRVSLAAPQIGRSADGGKSWAEWRDAYPDVAVRTDFESYCAPGTILKLPSGKIAIVHTYRDHPFGVRAVVSRDGGRTFDWDRQHVLEDSFWTHDCGYPSTVCYDDGTIVTVAYTIFDLDHPDWGTCAIAYVYHEDLLE